MELKKNNWEALISFENKFPCVYGLKLGDDYNKSRIKLMKFSKMLGNERDFIHLRREYGFVVDVEGANNIVSRIIIFIPSQVENNGFRYPTNIEKTIKELSTLFSNNIDYIREKYSAVFSYDDNDKLKDTKIHLENDIYTVEIQLAKKIYCDKFNDDETVCVGGIDVSITFNDYLKENGDIDHELYEYY